MTNATKIHIINTLKSPSTSYWLRDALAAALQRDALDAVRDAEYLAELLRARLERRFHD